MDIYDDLLLNEDLEEKGCIVVDAGVFFPYSNQDFVIFNVTLTDDIYEKEELEELFPLDKKYNHRYPNKEYLTISKKYKRRVSKIGYPFVDNIDILNNYKYLVMTVGFGKDYSFFYIPIELHLTPDNPCTVLKLLVNMEDPSCPDFEIYTVNEISDTVYKVLIYSSCCLDNTDNVHLHIDYHKSDATKNRFVYAVPVILKSYPLNENISTI